MHGPVFLLGAVRHLGECLQAADDLVALTFRGGRRGIAAGSQCIDFSASLHGDGACFLDDGLKFGQEQVDRVSHVAHFVSAVNLDALGQVAMAGRKAS